MPIRFSGYMQCCISNFISVHAYECGHKHIYIWYLLFVVDAGSCVVMNTLLLARGHWHDRASSFSGGLQGPQGSTVRSLNHFLGVRGLGARASESPDACIGKFIPSTYTHMYHVHCVCMSRDRQLGNSTSSIQFKLIPITQHGTRGLG